ncbi:MAG: efflux RND transporter periplasmic adaptor subunit [Gammaproteobacteria bacterium]|nr:efflux RND transporter periplasmic adaptor subunit [Gammaproteobacteria bacterium]
MRWSRLTASRERGRILLTLLVVVVLAAGVTWWLLHRPDPVTVRVAIVDSGEVTRIVSNTRAGSVKPCRRSRLAPTVGGQVAALHAREGDRVTAGQVLLELWNDDVAARLKLAVSERAQVQARAEEVCLSAQVLAREARRQELLAEQNMISEDRADRASTDAKSSQAACSAARTGIAVADAKVEAANAALDLTTLKAPFAGIVAEVNAEIGEFVTPSPPGIATLPPIDLIDDSCIYVDAPIDEVDAPLVAPGMPACVLLDAFAEPRCGASVRRVAPYVLELEKQARTVAVEVAFGPGESTTSLLTGYTADVEITVSSHDAQARVPTAAILENQYVLVLDDNDTIVRRPIRIGIANWKLSEVLSGLQAGERVVLNVDAEGVTPGRDAVVQATNRR